jgi:hypothetical protein
MARAGGHATVRSTVGDGTEVELVLPLAKAEQEKVEGDKVEHEFEEET